MSIMFRPAAIDVHRDLRKAEERLVTIGKQIANLERLRAIVEGQRDQLLGRLTDNQGCADSRFAVR